MPRTLQITPEEVYVQAATQLHHARNAYDHVSGNKAFDKLMFAAREIRMTRGDGGAAFFRSLVNHNLKHIVRVAAFNLIPLDPVLAHKVFETLSHEPGEIGFDAKITLREWDAGRLDFNWFMK